MVVRAAGEVQHRSGTGNTEVFLNVWEGVQVERRQHVSEGADMVLCVGDTVVIGHGFVFHSKDKDEGLGKEVEPCK